MTGASAVAPMKSPPMRSRNSGESMHGCPASSNSTARCTASPPSNSRRPRLRATRNRPISRSIFSIPGPELLSSPERNFPNRLRLQASSVFAAPGRAAGWALRSRLRHRFRCCRSCVAAASSTSNARAASLVEGEPTVPRVPGHVAWVIEGVKWLCRLSGGFIRATKDLRMDFEFPTSAAR